MRVLTFIGFLIFTAAWPAAGEESTGPASSRIEGDASVFTDTPTQLRWDDLMPEGEERLLAEMYMTFMQAARESGPIMEGGPGDDMLQIGTFNVVEDLDGEYIRIPGYPVPFDFDANYAFTEFLLVPYFGACIHTPPPPPNQIIYVHSDTPVTLPTAMAPVWIEGVLSTQVREHELGDAAYSLKLTSAELYE